MKFKVGDIVKWHNCTVFFRIIGWPRVKSELLSVEDITDSNHKRVFFSKFLTLATKEEIAKGVLDALSK